MTRCIFEGCLKPALEKTPGKPHKFCAEHRKVGYMTPRTREVLQQLADAKSDGMPFIALPNLHPTARLALIANDWIFESPGLDGVKYKITGRGEKALRAYGNRRTNRSDGMCPKCKGARPRHVTSTGRMTAFCKECRNAHETKRLARYTQPRKCANCDQLARRFSSGIYSAYCLNCQQKHNRKSQMRRIAAIRTGAIPTPLCKCGKPCVVAETYILAYCPECKSRRESKAKITRLFRRLGLRTNHAR